MYHMMDMTVKWSLRGSCWACYSASTMARNDDVTDTGTINIREVPRELLVRMKMACAVERRTLKGFLLALAEERIQELERKGLLPKGRQ